MPLHVSDITDDTSPRRTVQLPCGPEAKVSVRKTMRQSVRVCPVHPGEKWLITLISNRVAKLEQTKEGCA